MKEYHVLSRFFYDWVLRVQLHNIPPEITDRQNYFFTRVLKRFDHEFERKYTKYENLIAHLKTCNYTNEEEMVNITIDEVLAFAKANFTREELEKRAGQPEARIMGSIYLNKILDCTLHGEEIKVHLKPTPRFSPALLRDGLRILAKDLLNDQALSDVKTVSMTSHLLTEQPGIAERLGFTMENGITETGSRRAKIAREKFINKYGIFEK